MRWNGKVCCAVENRDLWQSDWARRTKYKGPPQEKLAERGPVTWLIITNGLQIKSSGWQGGYFWSNRHPNFDKLPGDSGQCECCTPKCEVIASTCSYQSVRVRATVPVHTHSNNQTQMWEGSRGLQCIAIHANLPQGLRLVFMCPLLHMVLHLPAYVNARKWQGELAFRAISYTPWPVPEDYDGVRLRIAVGERRNKEMR